MCSTKVGEHSASSKYMEKIELLLYGRRMKTNPPTVVLSISSDILAILQIFSRLVTAGVIRSFFLNIISGLTLDLSRNKSSLLKIALKGRILPPRRTRTPFPFWALSSFLKVAPVIILHKSLSLHHRQFSGISNAISSLISLITSPTCS